MTAQQFQARFPPAVGEVLFSLCGSSSLGGRAVAQSNAANPWTGQSQPTQCCGTQADNAHRHELFTQLFTHESEVLNAQLLLLGVCENESTDP